MAFFWNWHACNITSGGVTTVYNGIATDPTWGLPSLGCTGIKNDGSSAGGHTGKLWIGVLLLPSNFSYPSGNGYWLIVACGGGGTDADATTNLNIAFENFKTLINENWGEVFD